MPALHGGVIGNDHDLAAVHRADAGHDAGAGSGTVIHVVGGQGGEFQERGSGVEQGVNAFACQQLAAPPGAGSRHARPPPSRTSRSALLRRSACSRLWAMLRWKSWLLVSTRDCRMSIVPAHFGGREGTNADGLTEAPQGGGTPLRIHSPPRYRVWRPTRAQNPRPVRCRRSGCDGWSGPVP